MIQNFENNSILYYPTIELQNETWVKASLLFWDKIYRIVPPNYKPKDSDEIAIAVSNGFIENIQLSKEDLKNTAIQFTEFCANLKFIPNGFYSEKKVRLHSDKIDEKLRPFIEKFSKEIDKKGFYHLSSDIAGGYMFFLADTVSKRRNIGKLTDNPELFTAMSYFDVGGTVHELVSSGDSELYTTLIIENLIPADIRSIKIETILDLSVKLKNEKLTFRNKVNDFSQKASKIEDPIFFRKEIDFFKAELEETQNTKTEILKKFSKTLVPSTTYVGIPVLSASLFESLHSNPDQVLTLPNISKTIAIMVLAALTESGKAIRDNWISNKSNYYLDLLNNLDSKKPSSIRHWNLTHMMDEFIND